MTGARLLCNAELSGDGSDLLNASSRAAHFPPFSLSLCFQLPTRRHSCFPGDICASPLSTALLHTNPMRCHHWLKSHPSDASVSSRPLLSQRCRQLRMKQMGTKRYPRLLLSPSCSFFFPSSSGTTPTFCLLLIGFPRRQCPINCGLLCASALLPAEGQVSTGGEAFCNVVHSP